MTDKAQETLNNKAEDLQALDKCIAFLNSIGISTSFISLSAESFLPGLSIVEGGLIIDKERLKYPGDILHEAGHIAVVPLAERGSLNATSIEKRPDNKAEEMMAIAWSYAACVYLELNPYFVFHNEGYKGGGSYIADNFINENYFGLPMLQWKGMTADKKNAASLGVAPYPAMIKWTLD